jgi:hypothetical protein
MPNMTIDVNRELATIGEVARLLSLVTEQIVCRLLPHEQASDVLKDMGSPLRSTVSGDPRTDALLKQYVSLLASDS